MTTIPSISQLYNDILADLQTEYGVSIPVIGKIMLRVFAFVQAAKLKLIYILVGDVQRNITPDTAYSTANGGTGERWGLIKLNRNPLPATQGVYTVTVTGQIGSTVEASTTFKSDDDSLSPGYLFILDNEHTMSTTSDSITLRALTGGTESKLTVGDTLTATQPLINVNSIATVTAETTAPTDTETFADYMAKVVESFRLRPQGGASADYRLWGKEDVAGVKEIYPYVTDGESNEVDIFIEANLVDSTDGKGTPTPTIITNVTNAIESVRPMGVFDVNYYPIVVVPFKINIAGSTFTTAQKALILTAMTEAIANIRPFIPGADTLAERNDVLSANNVINVVLNTIPGSVFGAVTLTVLDSPPVVVASYQFTNGEIPYLDSITYV